MMQAFSVLITIIMNFTAGIPFLFKGLIQHFADIFYLSIKQL